jgi:hypothetical protein
VRVRAAALPRSPTARRPLPRQREPPAQRSFHRGAASATGSLRLGRGRRRRFLGLAVFLGAATLFVHRALAFFLFAAVGGLQRGETGFLGLAQQTPTGAFRDAAGAAGAAPAARRGRPRDKRVPGRARRPGRPRPAGAASACAA